MHFRVRDWYLSVERWKRRAAAVVFFFVGVPLAWRSFLSYGSGSVCEGDGTHLTQETATCSTSSWVAWYRWPGTVLGLLLVLAALAILVHAMREQHVERARLKGRRARS